MIKLLCILNSLDRCNGISSYIMNYYNNIDLKDIQFDFYITDNNIDEEYKKQIEKNNGKIFIADRFRIRNISKETKKFQKVLEDNNYDIVYSNILYTAYFYFVIAKKCGCKIRILHSHNRPMMRKLNVREIMYKVMSHLAVRKANYYFACSEEARKVFI